jgi:hypothetical protein
MWNYIFLIALMLSLISSMHAYPEGAPTYQCDTMFPSGHGVAAKTTENPYQLTLSKTSGITAGETITVKLEKKDSATPDMKGFFFMAKEEDAVLEEGKNNVIGTFSNVVGGQRTNCFNAANMTLGSSAVTHRENTPVAEVTANWTAPASLPKQPKFVLTVVQSKEVFWAPSSSATMTTTTTAPAENGTRKQGEAIISLIITSVLFVKML